MRTLRYVLCDVFTDRALTGNALAVFTDARSLDDATMQALAREMNLSESVFVLSPEAGGHARIRIFTPRSELPFAGHPTLGAAFVLGGPLQTETVRLETGVGVIPVRLEREGPKISFGWMRQKVPSSHPFGSERALLDALGVSISALPILEYDNGARHVYVVVDSAETVRKLEPDYTALRRLDSLSFNVLAVDGTDVKTRVFAPHHGIAEDPATGSAAGPLAVHLARHGRVPFGQVLRISQGEEIARPSLLYAVAHGDAQGIDRVEVGGAAVIIGRGELRI